MELARKKPRFSYRQMHMVLGAGGVRLNHRRVSCVYREVGLAVRRKTRKRPVRADVPRPALTAANQEWAMDFAHDAMASGRAIRVLSGVDKCIWECLTLEVDTSLAPEVLRTEVHQPTLSSSVHRAADRVGAHPAWLEAAERVRGRF